MPFVAEQDSSSPTANDAHYKIEDGSRLNSIEPHEAARVAALRRYRISGTTPESAFHRIAALAAEFFSTPIVMISFFNETKQWTKIAIGLRPAEQHVADLLSLQTVQRHALHTASTTCRPDADTSIAFYAAAPLVTADGVAIGAFSVLDRTGRADLTDRDRRRLEDLAALVMDLLEVGIMRDVTQLPVKEEDRRWHHVGLPATSLTLQKLTAQLIHAQEIGRLGIWRQEIGSEFIEWSDSVYPMFGETKGQFSPTMAAIMGRVHPDDQGHLRAAIAQVNQGAAPSALEYRTIAADGTLRTVSSDFSCEWDEGGRIVATSSNLQDVTDQKHAKAVQLQSEKLCSIGQLTGGIAHDFNNVLTVVSVNLEMLGDMIGTNHPGEELCARAQRAVDNGAKLTRSLLSFARQQLLQPKPWAINQLLMGLQDMAAHSLGEAYPIALKLGADLPHCLLDRSGFESAVVNLLINSRDAMPDGGVITIATSVHHLHPDRGGDACQLPEGLYVCMSVSDAGIGVAPRHRRRGFDPFVPAQPVNEGIGQDLSTVIGFVQQSGGDIVLADEPDGGTRVALYFPVLVTSDASAPKHLTPDRLASSPAD